MVGHAERKRLLSDGAGLCSPGLWPPEHRFEPTGPALAIHKAFDYELSDLDASHPGGCQALLDRLWSGGLTQSPFPEDATNRLRDYVP